MRTAPDHELTARLGALGPEPRVVLGGNFATPERLLGALDASCERYRLFVLNPQVDLPERDGVVVETPFVGPGCRGRHNVEYLPMRLSLVPRCFASNRPPDAVLVQVSAPSGGFVSLGTEVNILPAAIAQVRRRGGLVVAQVNPSMPYTFGDAELELDTFDLAIEHDVALLGCERPDVDDASREIASRVADYARDGATIQCGIGKLPDAVCAALRARRGLGVWSEMVSDGVLGLERAGALDRSREVVGSFLGGAPELYEWAHRQERLRLLRTEVVNDPARIAMHDAMLSVNAAMEVDLFDQANASATASGVHSGFGGQPDFVSGSLHAAGGHAVVALRAWHDKTGRSTIVPHLDVAATSFQHSVVASEHGVAELFGASRDEQARRLIDRVAAPSARDELREQAGRSGLDVAS